MSNATDHHLQNLLQLLRQERDEDRQQYLDLIATIPLAERVEKGYSWAPLNILSSGFTIGNKPFIVVERTTQINEPHQMRSGQSIRFFTQSQHAQYPEIQGVINYVQRNKMKIIFGGKDLPEWVSHGQLGIDTIFDERTYREMEKAVLEVIAAKRNRLAELRDIILGKKTPSHRVDTLPVDRVELNRAQNDAVNHIINNYDIAVLHGPPGTGKTTTIVAAIQQLAARENTILVCAPSNAAADLLTERIAQQGLAVVRIGNISRVEDSVIQQTLDFRIQHHEESRQLKKIRVKAAEIRKKANQFRRNFGPTERRERRELRKEASELMAWAKSLEQRLTEEILSGADVICCTLVGAAHPVLDKMKFRTCFIDEAAQALEPATFIPMIKSSRVVLAGDPFQLPPTVKCFEAGKKGLSKTLIERLLDLHPDHVQLLNVQYRMHTAIMGFSNHYFYNGKLAAHVSVAAHRLNLDSELIDVSKPVVFVDTAGCGFEEKVVEKLRAGVKRTFSRYNPEEALILREHLLKLINACALEDRTLPSIALITPYREQVLHLENMAREDSILAPLFEPEIGSDKKITINTVDGFQGQERDVVYISLVRSNAKGEIGFLSDYRRMNVAMTRARKLLVVVGDSGTIGNNKFYQEFLNYCDEKGKWETAWAFMA